jgi:hypothetical protein
MTTAYRLSDTAFYIHSYRPRLEATFSARYLEAKLDLLLNYEYLKFDKVFQLNFAFFSQVKLLGITDVDFIITDKLLIRYSASVR